MRTDFLRRQWTSKQALLLVSGCLAFGIAGGWLIRGIHPASQPEVARPAITSASSSADAQPSAHAPAELKQMADSQAAPLLANLKAKPDDPDTLISVGNLYYDAQQYSIAVDYYSRALRFRPSDASVRTDMATAYWYLGNADQAIAEFNKALTYAPTSPNALFNLGIVKWQGKHDIAGAIADWKKLLDANPNYEERAKVRQMLSDLEKQTGSAASHKS